MNIIFITHFFVGFMFSEIPRMSVYTGHCPYSPIMLISLKNGFFSNNLIDKII